MGSGRAGFMRHQYSSIPAAQTLVLVQEDTKAAQVASEILSNTPCRVLVVFGEPSAACLKTAFELPNAHAQIVVAAASRIEHMAFLSRKNPLGVFNFVQRVVLLDALNRPSALEVGLLHGHPRATPVADALQSLLHAPQHVRHLDEAWAHVFGARVGPGL